MAKSSPKTASTNKALLKLKAKVKGAWIRSRKKPATVKGGGNLPPGINQGVARFSSYVIDQTDTGTPFVRLTGIGCEPEEVIGKRVTKTYYIEADKKYDKSLEDKLDELCSALQIISGESLDEVDLDEIEKFLDDMAENKPYFTFDTWLPRKSKDNQNPRVVVTLTGHTEWEGDEPEDEEEEEVDEDENIEEEEEEEEEETPKRKKKVIKKTASGGGKKPPKKKTAKDDDEDEEEEEDEDEVVDEDEDEDNDEEELQPPKKGDIFLYKPKGKKDHVECKVVAVSDDTVKLKEVEGGRLHADVPFDKLEVAD